MIVIKGKSQKIKHVENLIRKEFMTNNVVIVDAVRYNGWSSGSWSTIWTLNRLMNHKELINSFEDDYEEFKKFDWVVFYINSNEDSINDFKELDRKYPQNFIVTIQSNEGLTNKFYI
ncbi:hypothetical protein D7X33_25520 [Butyricicoccus sp. 1XD8-22]|nr:hypothetical protein D7X33_25520 [Butyricicoccus sp. 1XD8-22]